MPGPDRRPTLYACYAHAADIVAGITGDQLAGATPCPDFDVAALVDHLVGAAWRAVALGRGETPSGEEFPHVALADAPGELRRAGTAAEAAWADPARLASEIAMPWGETYTGATLVDMYLAELAAHTFDLARATGQEARLDETIAPVALEAARAMLRPEYRDLMGPGNPFGPEIEPPAGATAWERFAGFMGRQPRATPAPT